MTQVTETTEALETGTDAEAGKPAPDPSWVRLAAAASGVTALGLLVISFVLGEVIPPLLVFFVVFLGFAIALWRGAGRKTVIALVVVSAFAVLMNTPHTLSDLTHPESASGFVPSLLTTVASITTLAAAVMALVRRGGGAARWIGFAGGALVVALVGVSVAITAGVSDDERQDGDVEVLAEDVEFPAEVSVDSGGALFVENADPYRHTIVVDEGDIHQELPASTDRRVEVDLPAGTYEYYCDVPGHEDMKGQLTVG
jgi:plastocyanin